MSSWESMGKSNEWYTPKYIFEALDCYFDMDVCCPVGDLSKINTPTDIYLTYNSLIKDWKGFVWMNPPFGGRNGIIPWMEKIFKHGNGIALTPDRTSTDWWQQAAIDSDCHLQIRGKVKFINQNGLEGKQPSNGTTLFGYGEKAFKALRIAEHNGLGTFFLKPNNPPTINYIPLTNTNINLTI